MNHIPATLDMLPDGRSHSRPARPQAADLGQADGRRGAVAVVASTIAVAALALSLLSLALPVLILAGVGAWAAYRFRGGSCSAAHAASGRYSSTSEYVLCRFRQVLGEQLRADFATRSAPRGRGTRAGRREASSAAVRRSGSSEPRRPGVAQDVGGPVTGWAAIGVPQARLPATPGRTCRSGAGTRRRPRPHRRRRARARARSPTNCAFG